MEEPKAAIADRLKKANNILVTVSANPSVDQLAACIGLTLALNKLGKHATAVFSGNVPNTIEFLQPEKTLEKNTDSLRDFIIALDKAKADKLRYKVEDKVVKIFITPYKTSIGEKDLNFSQGDFNVDVVLALGVHQQQELDQAITAHGRILHDAAVATINVQPGGDLGTINWLESRASSLSELAVELLDAVDKNLLDSQMATAFLTGIVAETARFSNDKTFPVTMSISAELMAAGANQQLVATKLEQSVPPPPAPLAAQDSAKQGAPAEPPKPDDGTLEITHTDTPSPESPANKTPSDDKLDELVREEDDLPRDVPMMPEPPAPKVSQVDIDEHGSLRNLDQDKFGQEDDLPPLPPGPGVGQMPMLPPLPGNTDPTKHMADQHMILQPPSMSGPMSATGMLGEDAASADPLSTPMVPGENAPLSPFASPASAITATPTVTMPPAAPFAPPPLPQPMPPVPAPVPELPTAPAAPPLPPAPALPPMPPVSAPPAPPTMPLPTPSMPLPPIPPAAPQPPTTLPPLPSTPPPSQTLSSIEEQVHSPHLSAAVPPTPTAADIAAAVPPTMTPPAPAAPPEDNTAVVDSARAAVEEAIAAHPDTDAANTPEAFNALPLGNALHPPDVAPTIPVPDPQQAPTVSSSAPPASPPPMMPPPVV
ncbi:MAG TPA: hypothetical protein VLF91_01445 [Candidatus Saccharimonadales bacterium]|nr:hypothetical protein [Candidatus Saccharimonadales bacterium]